MDPRRQTVLLSAALTVTIGVFGLFHPTELWVRSARSEPLKIENGASSLTLEGNRISKFRLGHSPLSRVTSSSGGPADFVLIVPGKIERQYRGVLAVQPGKRELIATINMDLELAVASVVAAESVPGAAIEALKSQAVVARSFYLASHRRHDAFDFCDTTHCQFIRQSPGPGTDAFRAAEATRGLVLTYRGRVLPALYSAVCGGHTRSLDKPEQADDYPYFAVECDYCLRHPGNPVRGHRLGLCQHGAAGMAAQGAAFRTVLNHYYPATAVAVWGSWMQSIVFRGR
jgi:peptidoglycan hydrolase-like amidase